MIRLHEVVTVILLAIFGLSCECLVLQLDTDNRVLTYSRIELLLLRASLLSNTKQVVALPSELRKRKRGRCGGVRSRIRKSPFKPPLPSIILSNVRSLRNKMDLLHAWCQLERAFRDTCIIALSETWLGESVSDVDVSLDNFTIIRSNSTRQSGKM